MSQRQEELKARMWEQVHKEQHDKDIAELQRLKVELDALPKDSNEYAVKKQEYDEKFAAAQDFFMKFYE